MIDINELRRKLCSDDLIDHVDIHANVKPVLSELIDRLESAEKERDWNAERLEEAVEELKALRAKIEAMERQEPAGYGVLYVEAANGEEDWDSLWKHRAFAEDHVKDFVQTYSDLGESIGAITVVPLYLAPGAQPAPSVPEAKP